MDAAGGVSFSFVCQDDYYLYAGRLSITYINWHLLVCYEHSTVCLGGYCSLLCTVVLWSCNSDLPGKGERWVQHLGPMWLFFLH